MKALPYQTCCFTGHRSLPACDAAKIRTAVRAAVRELAERGVTHYRVGGALGFDTLAAAVLFDLLPDYPWLHISLYYPFDGFYSRWPAEDIAVYQALLPLYHEVVRVCDHPPARAADAYLKRDRALVDGAGHVIAYCTRNTGGTAYTLRYAARQGCVIRNLAGAGRPPG